MDWEYRGRLRYRHEVCALCYWRYPNDQDLISKICYSKAEHRTSKKIFVTPVDDHGLQVVRPRPAHLPEPGEWFTHCRSKKCTALNCPYAHSQVEKEVWNTEFFHSGRCVLLSRNVPTESATHTTPQRSVRSLRDGVSLPQFGSEVSCLRTEIPILMRPC